MLKGAASAGLAAGSGAISGFPTIWAQNIKDVTLLQVGGSYSAIIDIARKASEDLGFKVEMQTADHAALLNRLVTQPESWTSRIPNSSSSCTRCRAASSSRST